MRRLIVFLLVISACIPARSSDLATATLNGIPGQMKHFVDQGVVAGVVTLVAQHGKVLEYDAEGMADVAAHRPMRKDTIFQIMSMTKPVTAVAIMMLAEEGKLALRDPVERHLPEFKNQTVAGGEKLTRPITIRDLLSHTAGMFDSAPEEIKDYNQQMNIPLADLVKVFARQPLLFQPGTRWKYSSPGIDILGRIIEVCSGKKYEDFITERILRPLGMKDSFFYATPDRIDRIAMVYEGHDGVLQPSPGTILAGDPARHRKGSVYPAPAWGLYSTAEDLLHFYQMMLNGGSYEGRQYLSRFSVDLMPQIQTGEWNPSGWLGGSGYGLAWEVVKNSNGEAAGHWIGTYGHGGAFGTQGWIDPKHELIRIMMIQRSNGDTDSMRDTFMTMAAAAATE